MVPWISFGLAYKDKPPIPLTSWTPIHFTPPPRHAFARTHHQRPGECFFEPPFAATSFLTFIPTQLADESAFALEFSKAAAAILGKPEQVFLVDVKHNLNLIFGGTHEPAFLLTVSILDTTNPENNEIWSKALFAFFKEKLNIPDSRGYIIFTDPGRAYWGWVFISRHLSEVYWFLTFFIDIEVPPSQS
ncbi:Tautomerase/MIF [Coprinellus micaceus]|uniref:L-dopachrome isomerase n=1 Tax=Coprinellus micaceus TaxID=71717 RepID=A0A4Y7SP46_COPMI|nr:Tautomerase/MIF [Coprinellus micaceus]